MAAGAPRAAALPGVAAGLRGLSLAAPGLLDRGLHQRGAIPAMAAVARRLRLPAKCVIFGHIHRRGPLPGEPAWRPLGPGGPRLFNTGSWVYDSILAGSDEDGAPRPYRPGGAVLVPSSGAPQPVDVLGHLPDRVLRGH